MGFLLCYIVYFKRSLVHFGIIGFILLCGNSTKRIALTKPTANPYHKRHKKLLIAISQKN